ncbi:MAG: ribosome-associated translation inhibitor RaiA [Clostridia bacterium]|nr:ribosome-associated translation inhibitor RaiA [Clostridia bacterium]
MKVQIVERKVNLKDATKAYLQEKLGKFEKVFGADASVTATFYAQKNRIFLEVTIRSGDVIIRAESDDTDARCAIDRAVGIVDGQMRKYKTKLAKKIKTAYVPEPLEYEIEEDTVFDVVKKKQFYVKPMQAEEAVLQMKLLNHQFFVYKDAETEQTCIVYARKDGKYGVIEVS